MIFLVYFFIDVTALFVDSLAVAEKVATNCPQLCLW